MVTGLTGVGYRSDRCERSLFCASCLREFAYVQGELFWIIALVVLLFVYRWRRALLASPVRSRYELCSQVILFLSCVWTFDHLRSLSYFVVDFSFIFHMVTVCVVNALIKGRLRTRSI